MKTKLIIFIISILPNILFALDSPVLVSPSNNATNQLTNITLDWNEVTNATSYEYWYSTDQYFSTFISGTTSDTEVLLTGLNNNTTYYWKVSATDGTEYSAWSEAWNFTTKEAGAGLATPTLISPSDNEMDQELSLTLLWNIVPTANEYEYQYSTDETFATYSGNTTQSSSISIGVLNYSTEYFWRIKATDGTEYSDWSEIWSFTTKTSININTIEQNTLNIYPNPTSHILHVSSNENIEYISVFNIVGKKVFEQNIANNNYTLNTTSFHNGIYLITFKLETKMVSKRFSVKH